MLRNLLQNIISETEPKQYKVVAFPDSVHSDTTSPLYHYSNSFLFYLFFFSLYSI